MANLTTIARPYAKAIISLAKDQNCFAQWSKMLEFLAQVVSNKQMNKFLRNLSISGDDKAKVLISLDPAMLTEQGEHLVKTLAHYKRLLIIPELYSAYEKLRKIEQKEITVKLFVAHEMAAEELAKISKDFSKELGAHLSLQHEFQQNLIGGGKIKIGDRVLDASIKNSLSALYKHLTAEQGHLV